MITLLTESTPENSLRERALRARCLEQGKTMDDLFEAWLRDQVRAAVNREPLTEESVAAAEARAQQAVADRADAAQRVVDEAIAAQAAADAAAQAAAEVSSQPTE